MTNFKFFNIKSLWRALAVATVAGLFGSVLNIFLSNMVDQVYRLSGSQGIQTLFYALSAMSPAIIAVLWAAILALFSNWILYPSYASFAHMVAQSLKLENAQVPELPKQFAELAQQLAAVHKDLELWKYATQEAEKRKDELVVYLAHDIRTPLTSVLGYLELLQENPALPPENRARFTNTALRKARRMKNLVEELFEVTRFNVGRIELHKEPVRAGVLLRQLAEEMAPVLEARQQAVDFDIKENTPLFADPGKLARAVDNVLHNAASYAPDGSTIHLSCSCDNGNGVIRISNEGAEISQAELDRYFEKFYRGDAARQSGTGGSGLGLAIARNIIEAHGGTITARNENRVTTFLIALPQNQLLEQPNKT